MKKGILVVLEGGDAAGKKTQTGLLVEALSKLSISVQMFDFPRYESPTGKIIGRALKGEFGNFRHLHPHLASALYTNDRSAVKDELRQTLADGAVVICNRYVPSNVVYQAAKLLPNERMEFIEELEEIEYDSLKLPRPDIVIYLDVPVSVSGELAQKRAEKDQHEADLAYQSMVAEVYKELSMERCDWVAITCTENGNLLSPDIIHTLVMKKVLLVIGA